MKIKLIETGNARDDPFAQCWYTPGQKRFAVPLLALPVVAALTPDDVEIEIIDEKIRDVHFDDPCDLACFSYKTKDAARTYRYADEFRKRGVPVILGGVHATRLPEEAAQHADSVVVGEAEGIWPQVMADFRKGRLQKMYRALKMVPLETAPIPRYDLLENDRYCVHPIQTSRGCLVGCEFCPIQEMFGGRSRCKPVDRVLAEIETVRRIDPTKDIFFVDEMFCGGQAGYQSRLLKEIRPLKIDFYCISDFKVINPAYVWDLAASGCKKLIINMPGTCLPQELKAVKAIQKLGVDVWGFFMFGFSFHDKTVFRKVVDFVRESGMKNLTITVMSPFPNTPMEKRISDRIFSKDWRLYDQCHATYRPERMSAGQLQEGFLWAWKELEDRLFIREEEMVRNARWVRRIKRPVGAAALGLQRAYERIAGKQEEPVDLEAILGRKKAEVAVTPYNVMAGIKHPDPLIP
ncbi:MAG: hypothetical protein NC819_00020 [Candidatus Omnitrophica bacterium]|nr:hypothetical protein [Candidatus Omnitrophota bacterium]